MEDEGEDGRKKINCLEEDLGETRIKTYETVVETRCDYCHQIDELEEKVYSKDEKAEEKRRNIHRQAEEIPAK